MTGALGGVVIGKLYASVSAHTRQSLGPLPRVKKKVCHVSLCHVT